MTTWHEQDEWWEAIAPVLFGQRAWALAPQQVEQVLALAGMEPPVRVLDMPAGVGRHALEFARLGCTVTAVDRTAAYLNRARAQAEELGLKIEFVQSDMRAFEREGAFDLAVNLFTSFGYFDDQADDLQVLRNFYTSLRPGGVFVMDMMGKEVLARIFQARDWRELEDGTLLLEERKVQQDWSWMENRWILIRNGERRDFPLSHRLYGATGLKALLQQAGFQNIRMYGDLGGDAYDERARRLIAVARRPD
ncbi:MAG TPA: class I SAM-dependent methyltransferase [Aggregatilineales bacterium]|nr:class I SAM-dependent methyltransferase [Aggregatilineales bacterium]